MTNIEQLEQTIAALGAQRAALGDAVVDTMLASARDKLATLRAQVTHTERQHKQAKALFADLIGFTPMAEKMDPEPVRDAGFPPLQLDSLGLPTVLCAINP